MDQVAVAKAGRVKHARHAPGVELLALHLVDRAGRGEYPPRVVPWQRVEPAERRRLLLQLDQVALAGQRQARQRLARHHLERIDPGQRVEIMGRLFLGMRNLTRQLVHQVILPLVGIAGFERIVITHCFSPVFCS